MRKEGPREVEQDPLMIMRGGGERERDRPRRRTTKVRVGDERVQENQVHGSILWTLRIPKM